jgi:PTS system nitrogen regulatory IIA component
MSESGRSRLCEVLERSGPLMDLQATDLEGVFREQLDAFKALGKLTEKQADELLENLMRRERAGTTGVGKGVALPRGRHPDLADFLMPLGRSKKGIEFHALDRQPVHIVATILIPTGAEEENMQLSESLHRCMRSETFRSRVLSAEDMSDVLRAITEL